MDETDLIGRSKEGDLDSFNSLVESYQGRVYNLSLCMLRNAQAAEDVTQDTFFSAWRSIGKFRGGSFKAWLMRIATNLCRDQFRLLKHYPTTSLDALPLDSQDPSSLAELPQDYTERLELAEELRDGLSSITPEQRLVVILCDVEGLSYEEIARVTGCSLGTVKSRLSRGRAQLRDYLRQHGTFPR